MSSGIESYYVYKPSEILPVVFAVLLGISLAVHTWQNFQYKYWRVMYLMIWGGLVGTSGWVMRVISARQPGHLGLYSAQYTLILCAPPIYSAAEYVVLGRLMHYVPMHAPLNPGRVTYLFIYLGAVVEGLSAAGASQLSVSADNNSLAESGAKLLIAGVITQAVVECIFIGFVGMIHYRCVKSNMLTSNIRNICIVLYGTSTLILLRCIYRVVEKVSILNVVASSGNCGQTCVAVLRHEWYLYVFEAAPVVVFTYWLNLIHPGRFLPQQKQVFLDYNQNERQGPGWQDSRSKGMTFVDLFDINGFLKGTSASDKFWERAEEWPIVEERNGKQSEDNSGLERGR
ncbi:RTA1 like protein-domain-containing protein [Bisporella sp. PMI_857]|nr:RTA1 like protein-domain-containing protein [Bisporella sp. PMI_857]